MARPRTPYPFAVVQVALRLKALLLEIVVLGMLLHLVASGQGIQASQSWIAAVVGVCPLSPLGLTSRILGVGSRCAHVIDDPLTSRVLI